LTANFGEFLLSTLRFQASSLEQSELIHGFIFLLEVIHKVLYALFSVSW